MDALFLKSPMSGILKISVCRIPIHGNVFIDWLYGYYLCTFMLRTCTDKMADPILLPIFAAHFAVFVRKQHITVNIGSKESCEKHDNHFSSGFDLGIIGTSSAFVKKR